jgi:hypothetical protein
MMFLERTAQPWSSRFLGSDATGGIGFDELVVEPKERVDLCVHIADIGWSVSRIHQEHGTDFDFVSVSGTSTLGASSEHRRSSVVAVNANQVSMSVSADDSASEAVSGKNLGGSIVDIVTQEDNAMVVEGSSVGRVPGEDCRGVTKVDVVRVPLDGEAHSHR